MNYDPQGYYARLDVARDSAPEAIHAAYRRKARLLHPDIPDTGNAAAFVAVKEAYDVLGDPLRRAAYDRAARSLDRLQSEMQAATEIHPQPSGRPPPAVKARGPRLSDLPLAVWAGLGVVALLAGIEAVLHLTAAPAGAPPVEVPATAPSVAHAPPPPPPHPIRLAGTTNVYVIPAGGPALLLRRDDARKAFVPVGQVPPFSAMQALRVLRENGLVEIRLTESTTGFIDAARLTPGNEAAARRAYCAYNAGPPPANGEVLARNGSGTGQVTIENRSGQPLVVKLRGSDGVAAATVFLAPGGNATVDGLPDHPYRPEYAVGELWSRACNTFAAGMRAQRFPEQAQLSSLQEMVVPPELPADAEPEDIPDQDFERE